MQNGWRQLDDTNREVNDLSQLLWTLPLHPDGSRQPTFPSASGVARKTADIATAHPGTTGRRAQSRHGRDHYPGATANYDLANGSANSRSGRRWIAADRHRCRKGHEQEKIIILDQPGLRGSSS